MPESFIKSYKAYTAVKRTALIISGVSLFFMMLLIVADVFSRNFLSQSISGSYEIVRNYFMPVTLFPALAFAYGTGIFPRITMVVDKLGIGKQRIIIIILLFFEAILFSLIAYYGLGYALESTSKALAFPAGGNMYPLYPFIFLVPICFLLILVDIVFLIIKNIIQKEPSLTVLEDSNQEILT